ncbi:MAG: SET domain-containing protein [Pseudomonas sp.]|nr:MAG: SET domain-containing protein [Pseudomonas sp.]
MTEPTCHPLFEVRASPIHGRGVHALHWLPRGTCLGTYEGRRYDDAALLDIDWGQRHDGMTYLFALSDGTTIDGAEGGNDLRFLNYACRPNCEAVEWREEDGCLVLRLATVDTVAAGAELFLDYGLVIDESESALDYPCRCGLPGCRGTLVAATT